MRGMAARHLVIKRMLFDRKKRYIRAIRDTEDDALSIACVVDDDRNILLVMQEDDRTRFLQTAYLPLFIDVFDRSSILAFND